MKLNYANFLLEKKLYDLLLETNIEFKDDLIKALKKVDHQIAKDLLSIVDQDVDVTMNLFDLGEKPDSIKFYNTNQIKEVEKDRYVIINSGQTYSSFRDLYKFAGLDLTHVNVLQNGTKGKIVKIWDYENAGHLRGFGSNYEIAQFLSDDGETTFIGMSGLREIEKEVKGSPQETRIGRVATKLLQKIDKKYSPKEVEEFVTKFKSSVEILRDKFRLFELVSGDDIAYWYLDRRYVRGNGTLQNSCMRYDSCEDFFSIYTKNTDKVSLLILKSEGDGSESTFDKITGRALVWKLDSGETFMDRIYYTKEEEVELFKSYARKNGWIFKVNQNMNYFDDVEFTDGSQGPMIIKVTLDVDFEKFPYMDTMRFLYKYKGIVSNQEKLDDRWNDYKLDVTDGWLSGCDTCEGEETIRCIECDGSGRETCHRCDGDGVLSCRGCDGDGYLDCDDCGGYGEIEGSDGEMEDCPVCRKGRIKCDDCGGDGEIECSRCDGDGNLECSECDGEGTRSCPDCQ